MYCRLPEMVLLVEPGMRLAKVNDRFCPVRGVLVPELAMQAICHNALYSLSVSEGNNLSCYLA